MEFLEALLLKLLGVALPLLDGFVVASHWSAVFPARGLHPLPVWRVSRILEQEVQLLLILWMEQVFAKIAYRGESVLIDPDQVDLLSVAVAIALESHHRRQSDDGRHPGDLVSEPSSDPLFIPFGLTDTCLGSSL